MFIPFRISLKSRIGFRSQSKIRSAIFYVFLYIMAMMLSLSIAYGLQKWSLDSLYTYAGKNSLYLAVHKMKTSDLQILAKIAVTDERAAIKIDSVEKSFDAQFLNYVLPANWFISEIPMNNGGHGGNHFLGQQANENDHLYKIIFTRAVLSDNKIFSSKNLLSATVFTVPLVEVWIDLVDKKVIKILEPPQEINYENIPLPVY